MTDIALPLERAGGPSDPSRFASQPEALIPGASFRARTWANLYGSLNRETDDQRWLSNAAQWLRDNPDTSEDPDA